MDEIQSRIPIELLDRYLAGECTPREVHRVQRWVSANPEHGRVVQAMRGSLRESGSDSPRSTDAAWARLAQRLASDESVRADIGRVAHRRAGVILALRAAAVVLLMIGAGALWRSGSDGGAMMSFGIGADRMSTGTGERALVRLRDGTEVTLAPTTRLRTRRGFGAQHREVELEGQAFFRVATDSTRPFRVIAGPSIVQVLGTEFDLRVRGDSGVEVAVSSGRVSLKSNRDAGPAAVLGRGEVGRMDPSGRITTAGGDGGSPLPAWTRGWIVFEQTAIEQVVLELERWYDIDLTVADPALARRALTARFTIDQPVEEVVATIGLAMEVRVVRRGRTFSLVPGS